MELAGQSLIAASRERVWAALNDPAVLARCIDGVESLTRVESDAGPRFEGRMNAKVGPVRATFAGGVTLTEMDPPNRYVLVGEGKGGVAGFAKGSAVVELADADGSTELRYTVSSSVGGKLAQLGARLIEGAAKGYAETFFSRFKAEVEAPPVVDDGGLELEADVMGAAAAAGVVSVPPIAGETPPTGRGVPPLLWGAALIIALALLLAWQMR